MYIHWFYVLTLAGIGHFAILDGTREEGWYDPPRVWPLIELELRDKNERAGRGERKPMIPEFKVFVHLVMTQVR